MNPLMNSVGSNAEEKLNCINAVVITQEKALAFASAFFNEIHPFGWVKYHFAV